MEEKQLSPFLTKLFAMLLFVSKDGDNTRSDFFTQNKQLLQRRHVINTPRKIYNRLTINLTTRNTTEQHEIQI